MQFMTMPTPARNNRRIALVTGVSRQEGIGAAIARRLYADGLAVATSGWPSYDSRMPWVSEPANDHAPEFTLGSDSSRSRSIEANLEDPGAIPRLFDQVESALGTVDVLVLCHCESVDGGILETTLESFDRHFSVNARATWLLIREFALRCQSDFGEARIIALTSDANVGNVAYGASKAALDRITLAAAQELSSLGVTANLINPGPTDTGWMSEQLKHVIKDQVPLKRLGLPQDVANLVSFLCSPEGGFLNGQLLHSNGGFQSS